MNSLNWWWRGVLTVFGLSIGVLLGAALLLSLGLANPPQAQNLIWEDQELLWAGGTASSPISSDLRWFQSPVTLPRQSFTLEVAGTLLADQSSLANWGVWIALDDGKWLIIGVNGFQYVTARYCPAELTIPLHECTPATEPDQGIATVWKFFNRIAPINQENRLQLHYLPEELPERLTLRFAGEWMWNIAFVAPQTNLQWGLWQSSGSDDTPHLQWSSAIIWSEHKG